jgi:hypothetical protein
MCVSAVLKYRRLNDDTLPNRLAKLNLHSVMKKSSRLTTRLSTTLGLTQLVCTDSFTIVLLAHTHIQEDDASFKRCEQSYRQMQRTATLFINRLKSMHASALHLHETDVKLAAALSQTWLASCAGVQDDDEQSRQR